MLSIVRYLSLPVREGRQRGHNEEGVPLSVELSQALQQRDRLRRFPESHLIPENDISPLAAVDAEPTQSFLLVITELPPVVEYLGREIEEVAVCPGCGGGAIITARRRVGCTAARTARAPLTADASSRVEGGKGSEPTLCTTHDHLIFPCAAAVGWGGVEWCQIECQIGWGGVGWMGGDAVEWDGWVGLDGWVGVGWRGGVGVV